MIWNWGKYKFNQVSKHFVWQYLWITIYIRCKMYFFKYNFIQLWFFLMSINKGWHFFVLGEKKERCEPVNHCWTPDSKLYCGCKGGQVICIDTENNQVTMVLNPNVKGLQQDRRDTQSLLRKATMESIAEMAEGKSKSQ